MALSHINNVALSSLSAINGQTLSGLSEILGQTISAGGGISIVQTKTTLEGLNTVYTNGQTMAFDSNVTAGNTIIIAYIHNYDPWEQAPTDSGANTYTKRVDNLAFPTANGDGLYVYSAPADASEAITVTFNMAGGTVQDVAMWEISGLNNSAPFDQVGSVNTDSTSPCSATAVTPNQNDSLLLGYFHRVGSMGTITADEGNLDATGTNGAITSFVQGTAASKNMSVNAATSVSYPVDGVIMVWK